MTVLYLATDDGLWRWRDGNAVRVGLSGKRIQSIVRQADDADVLHAAIRHDGVYRTEDSGAHWRRVLEADVWSLIHRSDRCEFVYAGTEPACVYRSSDYGRTWVELDAIRRLPTYQQWWFPPPPHVAHITSFVAHPHDVKTMYVSIEIGGVIVTHDGGRTWEEQHHGLMDDVHALTCSASPFTLYAATADGFHESGDLGECWRRSCEGLDRDYSYGILRVSGAGERLLLASASWYGASDSVLYRSGDGGKHWERAMDGMPSVEINGRMVLAADPDGDGACFAGLPDGRIMHSGHAGAEWHMIAQGLPRITFVTAF